MVSWTHELTVVPQPGCWAGLPVHFCARTHRLAAVHAVLFGNQNEKHTCFRNPKKVWKKKRLKMTKPGSKMLKLIFGEAKWQPYFARSSSLVTNPQPLASLKFLIVALWISWFFGSKKGEWQQTLNGELCWMLNWKNWGFWMISTYFQPNLLWRTIVLIRHRLGHLL